ncbi:MAG TPA: hypothetical protein VMW17_12445 [Candidatus Binatia bacterium]|nr:hypothetical protein [Candidatus Binatia bacterium]
MKRLAMSMLLTTTLVLAHRLALVSHHVGQVIADEEGDEGDDDGGDESQGA